MLDRLDFRLDLRNDLTGRGDLRSKSVNTAPGEVYRNGVPRKSNAGESQVHYKRISFPHWITSWDPEVLECRPNAKWLGMIWDDDT